MVVAQSSQTYHWLHLSLNKWGINCSSNWVQTWHVLLPSIQSLEQAVVVEFICFRSTKYSLQECLDVKNNFQKQVCFFCARNVPGSWEKWNMSRMHWSKTYKQLAFGVTFCFNDCQTLNVWQHIVRKCFLVSCPRLDATGGKLVLGFWTFIVMLWNNENFTLLCCC